MSNTPNKNDIMRRLNQILLELVRDNIGQNSSEEEIGTNSISILTALFYGIRDVNDIDIFILILKHLKENYSAHSFLTRERSNNTSLIVKDEQSSKSDLGTTAREFGFLFNDNEGKEIRLIVETIYQSKDEDYCRDIRMMLFYGNTKWTYKILSEMNFMNPNMPNPNYEYISDGLDSGYYRLKEDKVVSVHSDKGGAIYDSKPKDLSDVLKHIDI